MMTPGGYPKPPKADSSVMAGFVRFAIVAVLAVIGVMRRRNRAPSPGFLFLEARKTIPRTFGSTDEIHVFIDEWMPSWGFRRRAESGFADPARGGLEGFVSGWEFLGWFVGWLVLRAF